MQLEPEVSPDAETQNPAPEAVETPEVAAPEVEQTPEPEASETEESKSLKRMQRRIDKRTADLYRERAEKEQLAQRLAQFEASRIPSDPQELDPAQIERVVRQQAQEIAHAQRITEKCNAIADEGKRLAPDFDRALQTLTAEAGPLFERNGRPTPLMNVILESDKPAKLLHHLGTNPDLAADLADLTPTQLARKLDRIERDMSESAKPKTSQAPKPLTPVKGANTSKDPSSMTDAEFAAWRKAQIAQRR